MVFIRRLLFLIMIAAIVSTGIAVLQNSLYLKSSTVKWPQTYKTYTLSNQETTELTETPPKINPMPDVKQFTMATLTAKIPALESGSVRIVEMKNNIGFDKFTEIRRQTELSDLQDRKNPIAIEIMSGIYDMNSLYEAVNDTRAFYRNGKHYTLRIPVYVGPRATLIIRGNSKSQRLVLKLSSGTGAFLVNGGKMFIVDADVIGWDEKKKRLVGFEKDRKFRPFITSWSNSETYMGRSRFYDLGYAASKSYGISFSSHKPRLKINPYTPAPRGWLIDCHFEGLYYGFYSYEAEHVSLINNVYANNIVYGIDPHDRSSHLLIAGNEAYGTQKKHGIIVSREVNDSWIINNYSHDNQGSGFMLDRTSVRNLIANNVAFRNGNDGLTLFESGNNVITGNKFILNGRSGLRVRNSSNVIAEKNLYLFNKTNGAQAYSFDITKTEDDRNFLLDPFTQHVSLTLDNSLFAFNQGSMFKFNNVDLIRLSKLRFVWYEPRMIRGDFGKMTYEMAIAMRHKPYFIEVRKAGDVNYISKNSNSKIENSGDSNEDEPE